MMLENRGMIQNKITRVTTVISIINWKEYQFNTEQTTEQNTEQPLNRIQTNKKVKKEKNTYALSEMPLNLNGELFYKTEFFFVTHSLKAELKDKLLLTATDDELKVQFNKMNEWLSSNKPKKDYKRFFLNWFDKPQFRGINNYKPPTFEHVPAAHKYL
jgi:hypothetical protein